MKAEAAALTSGPISGSFEIGIAGETAVCDWRGIVFFPDHNVLAVSDLHFEKGSSFARRGRLIPPYDTHQTVARLTEVVADYRPALVICLGDSFHDNDGDTRLAPELRDALTALASGRDWCWIAGNHDPAAPRGLPGFDAAELAVSGLIFRHEPQAGPAEGEVAGHLHPAARIRRRGRSVRRACFASDGTRLIMPAFGAFTGSLNVRSDAYAGLFEWRRFHAYMLGDRRVYPIAACQLLGE